MKSGTFYAVGLGPGDPELVTRKAIRILAGCHVIAAPKTHGDGMLALSIAQQATNLEGKAILPITFPMERNEERRRMNYEKAASDIETYLSGGQDVALLNLGDVSIYATGGYLAAILRARGYKTELVPGIPSFCAAAARLGISLTERDTPLHILPAGSVPLEEALELPGTKVLMKAGRRLPKVVSALEQRGLLVKASLVENCGLPGERVCADLSQGADFGYFTTVIVKE